MRRLRIITDGTGDGTRTYDDETGELAASLVVIEPTLGLGEVPQRIVITNIGFPDSRKAAEPPCCRNCKWWSLDFLERPPSDNKDYPPDEWGVCLKTASDDGEPIHAATRAYAVDWEIWRAVLQTAPEFCCTQYQPKERAVHADDADYQDSGRV